MRRRVGDILLVSSLYDAFILSADGQLDELMLNQFVELNLRQTPGIRHVSSGSEAVRLARDEPRFNLIIASMSAGDMDALTLAREVKAAELDVPVVLLAYDRQELTALLRRHDVSLLDRIFLWQGDVRLLLAIVNDVEDRWNVAHDTGELGVQAVLVIEDNIQYYSAFLPAIYGELLHQSHQVAPEGVNLSHKLLRVQSRPKILLCTTFEEAWYYFSTYEENILGVISDIEFTRDGVLMADAGVAFAREVRARQPDVPIMLQSSQQANERLAQEAGAAFLVKGSPFFLNELREFIVDNFGFGDFVFRLRDGREVGRAGDLKALEEQLQLVPAESISFHASRNHFSKWLKARTEFALAHRLRPLRVEDFSSVGGLRDGIIDAIRTYRDYRDRASVADFDRTSFEAGHRLYRIGGGSLGGKARGLAFVNWLLDEEDLRAHFDGVEISVPAAVVLGTDVFDQFLDLNDLRDHAMESTSREALLRRFQAADLPELTRRDLLAFVERVRYPLAVRSSSLLEDSQYQPFAGVYDTFMLPNDHPDTSVRYRRLVEAIKRVYASTFTPGAKTYLGATPYRLEQEKMAVVLQRLVGTPHGGRFYPSFAGVARSHNYYPAPPMTARDGIAAVALGLGAWVVDGEVCARFCPRFPKHMVQFSSVRDLLRNSQRAFHALRLGDHDRGTTVGLVETLGLDVAEADGTLAAVGSTYSSQNDAVYDGTSRPGVRLVTFAPVLKHGVFPLAGILARLLEVGVRSTSADVELEFAVTLPATPGDRAEFACLQLRPLAPARDYTQIEVGHVDQARILCQSQNVLGHGTPGDVRDALVVDQRRFDRSRSHGVAQAIGRFNAQLVAEGRSYLLVGVGRWGSRDPHLGIPVSWDQIAGARAIVESGFADVTVTPSQGTHFFQNLSSSSVGYFTVNPDAGDGTIDWAWLAAQPAVAERGAVRHLRFEQPLTIRMDGRAHRGVILKPEPGA